MKTKELKKVVGLEDSAIVNIWELNYGFKSDLQGESTTINMGKDTSVDLSKLRIMTLVYGIYECAGLNINKPADLEMGFSLDEKKARIIAVRKMNKDAAEFLYNEINKFNTEVEPEVLKKSSSPLTEKKSEIQE